MTKERQLRYENKYLISVSQARRLRLILDTICFRDENTNGQGQYNIRSLYLDDYWGSAYNDNEIGVDQRSKYRIRIYDSSEHYISLERKIKIGGKIGKDRAPVSKEFFEAVREGELQNLEYPCENPIINRFLTECQMKYLRPAVIVDYVREPYVYPEGDVRITFDMDIGFSNDFGAFFDKKLFLQPILAPGMMLLEVKYTGFLPEFIHRQLQSFHLQQCTFSKYYLCKKYERMGRIENDIW